MSASDTSPDDAAVDAVRQLVSPGEYITVTRYVVVALEDCFQLPANRTFDEIASYECHFSKLYIHWASGEYDVYDGVLPEHLNQFEYALKRPDADITQLSDPGNTQRSITTLPTHPKTPTP